MILIRIQSTAKNRNKIGNVDSDIDRRYDDVEAISPNGERKQALLITIRLPELREHPQITSLLGSLVLLKKRIRKHDARSLRQVWWGRGMVVVEPQAVSKYTESGHL
jgi:hypothetical protein